MWARTFVPLRHCPCVPSPVQKHWHLIFRQTAGTYLSKAEWGHYGTPDDDNYSILNELERFQNHEGCFLFKIVYPGLPYPNFNVWKQCSNFMRKHGGGVDGYEALEIHLPTSTQKYKWVGLERTHHSNAVADGTGGNFWFYAIGVVKPYNGGIPGPMDTVVQQVELYAKAVGMPPLFCCIVL